MSERLPHEDGEAAGHAGIVYRAASDALAPILRELQAIHETIRLALTEPEGPELASGGCPHPVTAWSSDGSAKVCGECKAVIA